MISKAAYRKASMALKTMSRDDTRVILKALSKYGEMTVTALWIHTRAKYHSDVCQVMKKLRDAKVVSERRDGKWIHYSLSKKGLRSIRDATKQINNMKISKGNLSTEV